MISRPVINVPTPPVNPIENILKTKKDPYLILRNSVAHLSADNFSDSEIIKVFNWGQLKTGGIIKNIYPELGKYKEIVDGVVITYNGGYTEEQNVKIDDNYMKGVLNVASALISPQHVLVTTSKSDLIEFNGMLTTPTQMMEMRNSFTASFGHELRTPLTSIINMIDLLTTTTELTSRQRDLVTFMHGSSIQLASLINDIMNYTMLEDGRTKFEHSPLNLQTCIDHAFSIVAADFPMVKINYLSRIEPNCRVDVIGDSLKIRQILINLVKNAVKFSADGSNVTVHLKSAGTSIHGEKTRIKYIFDVIDEGIGIAAADIEKLFVPYSQLNREQSRKKYGGTGLGLIISKKLCNLMGGNITVRSEPGKGSTFSFTLVLEAADKPAYQPSNSAECMVLMKGRHVLIVDDIEEHRIRLAQICRSWGANFVSCSTPKEALSMVDMYKFDLGILDYFMGTNMNGRELSLELRRRGYGFPLIILSSLNEHIDGPFNLLFKPIVKSRLDEIIKTIFSPVITTKSTAGDESGPSSPTSLISPRSSSPGSVLVRPIRKASTSKSEHILVVDDYEAIRYGVVESLHYLGYTNVDSAEDGQKAVKMVERSKADKKDYRFIFMDIVMPVMDGVSAVIEINKLYANATGLSMLRPYIIALTANTTQEDETKYLRPENGGMNAYLFKPLSIQDIKDILSKAK